jgi:hypothetical protein
VAFEATYSNRWPQLTVIRSPWAQFKEQLSLAQPLSFSAVVEIAEGDAVGLTMPPSAPPPEERVIVYPTFQNLLRVLDKGWITSIL